MTERKALKMIDSGGVQIRTQHTFVIARAAAIEKPIRVRRPKMNRSAGPDIEHRKFRLDSFRPARLGHVIMTCGQLRKRMHQRDDGAGERPVRVVENNR